MNTKTKELRIDRIEENIAIAYDSANNEFSLCKSEFNLSEGDIIEATFSDTKTIVSVIVKAEKTAKEKDLLVTRLSKLFNK